MRAVVFHGPGAVRLEDVADPTISEPFDAVIRTTASAGCGTDLHFVRGTMGPMREGTVLGHEAVGMVEEVGPQVRNPLPGDRVVVPSTIACGWCAYCRAGYFAQCDNANPDGPQAGTAFHGGPEATGSFDGLQAEKARTPYANVGLVTLPDEVSDDLAIMLSDVYPTGWFGARLAEVLVVDTVASRLDAVGADAEPPTAGPAAEEARQQREQFDAELARVTVEDAYQHFSDHDAGWIKVELVPVA